MHSNKNKIFLGVLVLIIVILVIFLYKNGAKSVTLTNMSLERNLIEFIRIEGNRYKCKSTLQKLSLDALQTLPSKSSVMLKIEKPEEVFFSNNKDTIVRFLETKIENENGLPVIEYELVSTWELEKLKLASIYIEVYFSSNSQSTNYNYETKFISRVIE